MTSERTQDATPGTDEQVLRAALRGLMGTADDPNIGWRGHNPSDADHYQCEFCREEHLDCTMIIHAQVCPITAARRALGEQPVNPIDAILLAEAKAVITSSYGPTRNEQGELMPGDGPARVEAIKDGRGNAYWEVRATVAALKRGMELGREQQP